MVIQWSPETKIQPRSRELYLQQHALYSLSCDLEIWKPDTPSAENSCSAISPVTGSCTIAFIFCRNSGSIGKASSYQIMKDWLKYNKGQNITLPDADAAAIAQALPDIYGSDLSSLRPGLTNKIKFVLLKLGYQLGYCGYANLERGHSTEELKSLIGKEIDIWRDKFKFKDHRFRNREWLYDIHWYRDNPDTHFMPATLNMACECELHSSRGLKGQKEHGKYFRPAVRYDFQKLLASNAMLRVMIFRINSELEVEDSRKGLSPYFIEAIESYQQLPTGSKFFFICLHYNNFYYRYYEKSGR